MSYKPPAFDKYCGLSLDALNKDIHRGFQMNPRYRNFLSNVSDLVDDTCAIHCDIWYLGLGKKSRRGTCQRRKTFLLYFAFPRFVRALATGVIVSGIICRLECP